MSKIYTVPELQTVLSPIFREHGVKKATLFGSYAKGAATSRSDVDLLVDSGLRGLAFFWLAGAGERGAGDASGPDRRDSNREGI